MIILYGMENTCRTYRTCRTCGDIFEIEHSKQSKLYCSPECRLEYTREYHRDYNKVYNDNKNSRPYRRKTFIPTNRQCEFCNGIIYKIVDSQGVIEFDRRYYCHLELCQQVYKDRSRGLDEINEIHLEEST